MTLSETKKNFFIELGLLERHTLSDEYEELSSVQQERIERRITKIDEILEILCNISVTGFQGNNKAVIMYNQDGSVIRCFDTVKDASFYMGDNRTNGVWKALTLTRIKYKDFYWRYVGSGFSIFRENTSKNASAGTMIQQLTVRSNGDHYVKCDFKDLTEAAEYINPKNVHSAKVNISKCCHNSKKTYMGYAWRQKVN